MLTRAYHSSHLLARAAAKSRCLAQLLPQEPRPVSALMLLIRDQPISKCIKAGVLRRSRQPLMSKRSQLTRCKNLHAGKKCLDVNTVPLQIHQGFNKDVSFKVLSWPIKLQELYIMSQVIYIL